MNNNENTTITLTINGETREIEARRYEHPFGGFAYSIDVNLIAVRIGHGAKWHKATWIDIREVNGKPQIRTACALNKNASAYGWASSIKHDSTKSDHVGSKIN